MQPAYNEFKPKFWKNEEENCFKLLFELPCVAFEDINFKIITQNDLQTFVIRGDRKVPKEVNEIIKNFTA
jgi:hypothetical protein